MTVPPIQSRSDYRHAELMLEGLALAEPGSEEDARRHAIRLEMDRYEDRVIAALEVVG